MRVNKLGTIAIRIKRPWRGYPVGTVIYPPVALRKQLIKLSLGEEISEEAAKEKKEEPVVVESRDAEIADDDDEMPVKKKQRRKNKSYE
jgi:hypothetical protein